jgi:hypothetical protein
VDIITPAELTYLGAVGGLIGIFTAAFNWAIIWRNRRRIEFRVITAERYYEEWTQWDFDQVTYGTSPPNNGPVPPLGSWRRALTVLEFVIKNEYPTEVTVGRIVLDHWMFDDHYTRGMYAPIRDYRVFDLYTREPISLASYKRISPKGSYALRVEVFDDTEGPGWHSSKSRYWLDFANYCTVEFHTDVGLYRANSKHLAFASSVVD